MSVRDNLPVPGDAMLHPVGLASVALLLVNDHVLKTTVTGFVSGKLSDFAGVVFFPLLVLVAWEVLLAALGRWRRPTIYSLGVAVASTGVVAFVLVKTTAAGSMAFAWALGWLQWVAVAGWSALTGAAVPRALAATVVQDPSDLIALVALVVALVLGLARLPGRGLGLMVSKTS